MTFQIHCSKRNHHEPNQIKWNKINIRINFSQRQIINKRIDHRKTLKLAFVFFKSVFINSIGDTDFLFVCKYLTTTKKITKSSAKEYEEYQSKKFPWQNCFEWRWITRKEVSKIFRRFIGRMNNFPYFSKSPAIFHKVSHFFVICLSVASKQRHFSMINFSISLFQMGSKCHNNLLGAFEK